jgi:hypothetical protein
VVVVAGQGQVGGVREPIVVAAVGGRGDRHLE